MIRNAVSAIASQPLRVLAAVVALAVAACAPPKSETSFLRSVDLVNMTDQMSLSFSQAPEVLARNSSSPRWVVSIDKITNNTNQVIPENEKWAYIGRLRALLTQTRLSEAKNIAWVVPPERWPLIASELKLIGVPPDLRLPPTHVLTGEFAALTNTSGQGRSDAYVCSYQLVDLKTGALVWEDSWQVKRAVSGKTYD